MSILTISPTWKLRGFHFYTSLVDILQEGGRGGFPADPLSLSRRNCCIVVDPVDPVCQGHVSQVGTGQGQVVVLLLCSVGAAVLEHELVSVELFVLPAQKPDCDWLVLCGLSNGLPHISLMYVDLLELG